MSTVTIPAHLLQAGDRLNLHGYWHTAGRVTVENYDTGSEVHVVLDGGGSDARIGAHEGVQIALAEEPPTVRSEADAAGWGDAITWTCPHHGDAGDDTEHCPTCGALSVTSAPAGYGDSDGERD